jgi:hypothetical protein
VSTDEAGDALLPGEAWAAVCNCICAPTIKCRPKRWASPWARTTPDSEASSVIASAA